MPYTINKQKCKQADGDAGNWTVSYTDKKGKDHISCHTSRNNAEGQIAGIEMSKAKGKRRRMREGNELQGLIRQLVKETLAELQEAAMAAREEVKADAAKSKKGKLSNPDDPVDDGENGSEKEILKKAKDVVKFSKIK